MFAFGPVAWPTSSWTVLEQPRNSTLERRLENGTCTCRTHCWVGPEGSKSLADALAIGNSQRRHNRKHSGIVSEISSGTLEAFQLRLKYGTTTFMAPVPMPVSHREANAARLHANFQTRCCRCHWWRATHPLLGYLVLGLAGEQKRFNTTRVSGWSQLKNWSRTNKEDREHAK